MTAQETIAALDTQLAAIQRRKNTLIGEDGSVQTFLDTVYETAQDMDGSVIKDRVGIETAARIIDLWEEFRQLQPPPPPEG